MQSRSVATVQQPEAAALSDLSGGIAAHDAVAGHDRARQVHGRPLCKGRRLRPDSAAAGKALRRIPDWTAWLLSTRLSTSATRVLRSTEMPPPNACWPAVAALPLMVVLVRTALPTEMNRPPPRATPAVMSSTARLPLTVLSVSASAEEMDRFRRRPPRRLTAPPCCC